MNDSVSPQKKASPPAKVPMIGLALGSGAAKGWAHVGVLRALDEMQIPVEIYAGCSAGSLVSAARLLGIWDEFIDWARKISPINVVSTFGLGLSKGGLINPDGAFDRFRHSDRPIRELEKPWGAVGTDLGTGREVWMTEGSVLDACRASCAVPMVIQAFPYPTPNGDRWLIDGATSNPVPVTLARALGAERIISVDLVAEAKVLHRFNRPTTRDVVPVEAQPVSDSKSWHAPVENFLMQQSRDFTRRIAMSKAKAMSRPQFLETAIATVEIMQAQLAQARSKIDIADVRLIPDLTMGSAISFDEWEAFDEAGYKAAWEAEADIRALLQP